MKEMKLEERNLKKKILILLVSMALLVGVLSGCTEEETTPAENVAPVSVITCVTTGIVAEEITFLSAATDEDGTIATYSWDLGDDDTEDGTEETFTTTFDASGTYTITLTVTDDDGDSHESDVCTIVITNPPVVTLGDLPETITNEIEITFEATATAGDAEINATTGYTWSIDNGTGEVVQEGTTSTFVNTFAEDGTYVVKVMVTDDEELTATATVTVEVPTPAVE